MTRKQRRLVMISVIGGLLIVSAFLVLNALNDSIVFFFGPSEVAQKQLVSGTRMRVGGLVKPGSVKREDKRVDFVVTDGEKDIAIHYEGLLPDLFREGQGVVAEGRLGPNMTFKAETVLAKHDEKYMPREVAESLKKQGHWQGDGAAK
jgi:cytochrome c-type biogenesis protein CcmE